MSPSVTLHSICAPSDDVVAREIEGAVIIVPLTAGIGDADDELPRMSCDTESVLHWLDYGQPHNHD